MGSILLNSVCQSLTCLCASTCRCEEPGKLPPSRERPGAGQRSAAGLCHVQLPTANGQVWPAAPPAAGDPGHQPAGRRIPLLQTSERGCALQQPAHRNATCQESLEVDFTTHNAAVQTFLRVLLQYTNSYQTEPPVETWLSNVHTHSTY